MTHMNIIMSIKQCIESDRAPAAIGPYSHAVKVNETIYVSGCIGLVKETKAMISEDVRQQAHQTLLNLKNIVEDSGSDLNNVVKCTVLLADMNDFAVVNEVYDEYFKESRPARACFACLKLPANARVEIDCICIELK